MIYLIRDGAPLACETDDGAQSAESRGYVRCSYAAFRAAWVERDRRVLAQIAPAQPAQPPSAALAAGQNYTFATPWPVQ